MLCPLAPLNTLYVGLQERSRADLTAAQVRSECESESDVQKNGCGERKNHLAGEVF